MSLAWKEIKHSKTKYLLIEIILILMIFMVLFLSGLANGLGRAVSGGIENADAKYFIVSEDAEDLITISNLGADVLDKVTTQTKDKITTLDIQRMNLNLIGSDIKLDVTYFAVDTESFLVPEVIEGDSFKEVGEDRSIILDDSFKGEGIKLGDIVVDSTTDIEMKVIGFTHDEYYGHTSIGVISVDTYTEIRKAINPSYEKYYHAIAIQGDDIKDIDIDGAEVVDKAVIIQHLPGYSQEQTTINMILWVLVFISGAIIGVFFYVITIQKERQYGVLKAIGMGMKKLTVMIMSQVFLLASVGMIIGNILVIGMAAVLPGSMPFYLKMSSAGIISIVFIAIAILSSLITVKKIAKVDPIIIMGGNE